MTLYAFKCPECLTETEGFYPMGTAPEVIDCQACEGRARRLLARGAFTTIAGAHNATYKK